MSEPSYPFPEVPATETLREVAPGVFWLRMPLPFALDHINLWLLRDGDGWLLVDTGFSLDSVKTHWEAILAGLDGPLKRIVVTHFHPDHLGLADWLQQRTGATLEMTAGEYLTGHCVWSQVGGHAFADNIGLYVAHGVEPELAENLAIREHGYRKGVPSLPSSYRRIVDGDTLTIGGRRWQVRVGRGHSPEHASLWCAELCVLISGDMLLPRISTNISVFAVTPEADLLGQYLESISDLEDLPEETLVLPSHGLPFRGLHDRVKALHAHHEDRLRVLEENCESTSAAESLNVLFPRRLDTHQMSFAIGEVIAHLNHLEQAGRLIRSRDEHGVWRYRRP